MAKKRAKRATRKPADPNNPRTSRKPPPTTRTSTKPPKPPTSPPTTPQRPNIPNHLQKNKIARQQFSRLARHLPKQLAERFVEAINDPELTSLREDVALVDTRRLELAKRLHGGESGGLWKSLLKQWGNFERANRELQAAASIENEEFRRDRQGACREEIQKSIEQIGKLIKSGSKEEQQWEELIDTTKSLASLKSAEQARLHDMNQMVSAEEATHFTQALLLSVTEEVTDPKIRAKIGERFRQLLSIVPGATTAFAKVPVPVAPSPSTSSAVQPVAGETIIEHQPPDG